MMHLAAALSIASLLASSAAGLPLHNRHSPHQSQGQHQNQNQNSSQGSSSSAGANDILVLQFANVLEQLETQFYTQALQTFQAQDFSAAGFADPNVPIQQIQNIASDESTHTTVLAQVLQSLNQQPISGCTFNFGQGLSSVSAMAPLARIVEYVGVGAYLGAAQFVSDPSILTAAASILTVEARHQTVLNILNDGTALPAAFDLPLSPPEVLSIAGAFIQGCSIQGVTALEALTVTNTGTIQAGTQLTFSSPSLNATSNQSGLSCQMLASGQPESLVFPLNQCTVPTNLTGPVAIYVTNSSTPLSGDVTQRTFNNVVAGPAMALLNGPPEDLGNVAVTGTASNSTSSSLTPPPPPSSNGTTTTTTTGNPNVGGNPSSTQSETGPLVSVVTQTISPEQASNLISAASSTAPAATPTPPPPSSGSGSGSGTGTGTGAVANPGGNSPLSVIGVSSVPNPNAS